MTKHTTTSRWLAALVTALLAAISWFAMDAPARAQEPAGPASPANDDGGDIVHSWALAPGDGSLEAGERPNLSYELPPGGEAQDVVTLFNYSNVSLTFDLYTTDAFNNEDGAFDLLPGDEEPTDVGTWVTLPQGSIIVPPSTQATFPITVHVPIDARPGDHAGAILASSPVEGTGPDGDVITVDRRTGSRIYVRVDGPLQPELAVEDLSTNYTPSLHPGDGRAEVRYRIVNRGNVRLGATHQLSVAGPFGLLRTSLAAEEVIELLPGESVEFTRVVEHVAATGLVFADVDLEPRAVSGANAELGAVDGASYGLALPFTLIALALVAILCWYARRAYLRHGDRGVAAVLEVQRG